MGRTIGVAIRVPEPWGSQLGAQRAAAGDLMAPLIPSHLTLLGPTKVDSAPELTARIEEHLAAVAAEQDPFEVHLRGTGTFRPVTQVVFVAVAKGARDCAWLADAIRSGPLDQEPVYAYLPHVTVAQDVPDQALDTVFAGLAGFEAQFTVDSFTLHEHREGGHWHPLRRFPLGEPG